jgi:hypothetical protein
VHCGSSGEEGGERPQRCQQKEDQPDASEVVAKQPEGWTQRTPNATVGLSIRSRVRAELNHVSLYQVEVDAQQRGGKQNK